MSQYQFLDPLSNEALAALREDIRQRGVLVPIEVDENGEILDGHHRAMIADELGIECPRIVRHFETEDEKREHVYKMNLLRRHLDSAAWGKAFRSLLEIRGARRGQGVRNDQTSATIAEVAREVGVSERTARQRMAHAETIETYPFMQKPDWKQYHVLEAREAIEKIPEEDRLTVVAMISEPAIPPKTAIDLIRNVANMKPQERQEICQLYRSDDSRKRSLAKTKAAQLPPEPDPRLFAISDAIQALQKCIKQFPNDPLVSRFKALVQELECLKKEVREVSKIA